MNMKRIHFFFLVAFAVLPALRGFAGGANEPMLTVADAPGDSRLVSINWSYVKQPQNYRWGLYRFNLEEKTYILVTEVEGLQSSYLDENLDPPVSRYFYKLERAEKNTVLTADRPIRIRREEVLAQLSSSAHASGETVTSGGGFPRENAGLPVKTPVKTTGRNSAGNEGIYVGMISFSGKVTDITQRPDGAPALVPLDAPGRQVLLEHLVRNYVQSKSNGAALYYADHKAIANLTAMEKEGALPGNLDSVTIITFTDGADTSSTDAEFTPIEGRDFRRRGTGAAYRTYISQQMTSRRIGGIKINSWAIGIRDKDIENNFEFSQTLEAIASDPEHIAEFSAVSQINAGLTTIANGLNIYTPRMNLTFSTPAYPVNTLLRLTFDGNIMSPDASEYYVDARVGWDSNANSYILSVLDSYGITLSGSRRIEGKRDETGIHYLITINNDFNETGVQQWYIQPGGEDAGWLLNSGDTMEKAEDFTHERKSAIVYLVLDCSSSLTEKGIDDIRTAMTAFINKLYEISSSKIQLETVGNYYYPQRRTTENTVAKTPIQPVASRQPESAPAVPPASQRVYGQGSSVPQSGSVPQTWQQPTDTRYVQQETRPAISTLPPPASQTSRTSIPAYTTPPAASQTSRTSTPAYTTPPASAQTSWTPAGTQTFYWVQIGSYTDAARAHRAWSAFGNIGLGRAEILSSNINGTLHYRVKAGPYTDKAIAEDILARIKIYSVDYKNSFIINE